MLFKNADAAFGVVDRAFKVIAWNVSVVIASKAAETVPDWPVQAGYWIVCILAGIGTLAFIGPYVWSTADRLLDNTASRAMKWLTLGGFWAAFTVSWAIVYLSVRGALAGVRL